MTATAKIALHPHVTGNALSLDVELENTWGEPVYVMTLLNDWYEQLGPASAKPTSQLAFVFYAGSHQVLIVNGESAPPPSNISLFAPRVPYGHKLRRAEKFRNTLRLPLPLLEWYAYRKPSPDNTQPEQIWSIRYRLEVVPASAARDADPLGRYTDVFQVDGDVVAVEAIADLSAPLTLLRRLEPDFKRLR